MAELIAADVTQTAWFDVVVASGASKALFIKPLNIDDGAPPNARFQIAHKTSGGNYDVFDVITSSNYRDKGGLAFPGTYGIRRMPCPVAAGMDVEG